MPARPGSPTGSATSLPAARPFQKTLSFWERGEGEISDTTSEVGGSASRISRRRRIPLHVRTTHPNGKMFSLEQVAAQIEAWRSESAKATASPGKKGAFSKDDVSEQISKWRSASRAHSTVQ